MTEHIGEFQMENEETIVTTWTELFGSESDILKAKNFMTDKMKKYYKYHEEKGITYFEVADNTVMYICALCGKSEDCLVMSYHSPDDNDDGDQFYISDYPTPDDMFNAMLAETRL